MPPTLQDRIAVVTGASRGIGKGIALELGAAGATVYVTGRTVEGGASAWPGTIHETADAVMRLGGRGIAVPCDHRDDDAVAALFQRLEAEQGGLDLLVNNVYWVPGTNTPRGIPFWELPIAIWDQPQQVGLRSHYVASRFAAPLMVARGRGLIVNISSAGGAGYRFNVAYGVLKAAVERLAADIAHELRPHGVAAVALRPGNVRTERVLANPWTGDRPGPGDGRESPRFVGRAVVALAADPRILEQSGQVFTTAELARTHGLVDPAAADVPAAAP